MSSNTIESKEFLALMNAFRAASVDRQYEAYCAVYDHIEVYRTKSDRR